MTHDFTTPLDSEAIRADFPILHQEVRSGVPLIYLDNAASSQKPEAVIEAMNDYYRRINANVHRGIHELSERATDAYEGARKRIARFINAGSHREVIYTRNTTESINLVAWTWAYENVGPGDVILSTAMEHHSNIVPWQILAQRSGATLRYIPVTDDGRLDMDAFEQMLDERVKLVTLVHASNVVGTINPVRQIADVYAFSAHKMCGPTGIGILYGKRALLEAMPPFMGGGDMIKRVTLDGSQWNELPHKFEAGTPAIAEAIGLGAAVDYLSVVGMENIHAHEAAVTGYALERLMEVPGVRIVGPTEADERGGLVAFEMDGAHPHDIAQILNHDGVAIRAGHHCAMPLHQRYDLVATARASFYLYNTFDEIDRLVAAL